MKELWSSFNAWFWNHEFWLPYGFTWDDLKSTDGHPRPQLSDLYITPAITLVILCIRYIFEKYIAYQFCIAIGIKNAKKEIPKNEICEQFFNYETKSPDLNQVKKIAAQTGWSTYQVSSWFRKKRNENKYSLMKKATESCWRCFAYFVFFIYGCFTLFSTEWFWDTDKWLIGYIHNQPLTDFIKWYYWVELAFYNSLLISQFFDTKRKDFLQLFIHHIVTIILIGGSYIIAHFRYGAVIMFLHDTSDYWLESAKVANYAKTQRLCDVLFVIFAITFFLTRWVYFPFWVLKSFIVDNAKLSGPMQSYITFPYIFLYMCFVLVILHIYWGFMIANMVYKFTVVGKVEKDTRSDESD